MSSSKGQVIKLDTNKVYTLNPITKSKLITNDDDKIMDLNAVFIDKKYSVNNEGYKFTPYKPSNSEVYLGEVGYWLVFALAIL